jgi:C-terminal processing protease CtpA/Prc
MRKVLFAPEAVAAEKMVASAKTRRVALKKGLETVHAVGTAAQVRRKLITAHLGYLRIFHFEAEDARRVRCEVLRLVEALPQEGLIIDVRGNGGGYIENGERLLQLFTPRSHRTRTV